jgi:hypothetical protein
MSLQEVFDSVRGIWVAATPEEVVRQTWIYRMLEERQFPKALLAVEKPLRSLPGIEGNIPDRRIDVLAFRKVGGILKPLLLMECKRGALMREALNQVIAYNYYVKAPYVAIVNLDEIMLYSDAEVCDFLPSFEEMICG